MKRNLKPKLFRWKTNFLILCDAMSSPVYIIFHHRTILINSKLIIFNILFFRGFGKQVSARIKQQVKYRIYNNRSNIRPSSLNQSFKFIYLHNWTNFKFIQVLWTSINISCCYEDIPPLNKTEIKILHFRKYNFECPRWLAILFSYRSRTKKTSLRPDLTTV